MNKPREWNLFIHGKEHYGFISAEPITDAVPFKRGVEKIKVVEKSVFDELLSIVKEQREVLLKFNGIPTVREIIQSTTARLEKLESK